MQHRPVREARGPSHLTSLLHAPAALASAMPISDCKGVRAIKCWTQPRILGTHKRMCSHTDTHVHTPAHMHARMLQGKVHTAG